MNRTDLLSARVPRYTSYPTANHFHPRIDAQTYLAWLATIDRATPLSLYVHVPFCDTLCWFCGCHTRVVNTYSPVQSYLDMLHREIEMIADRIGHRAPVRHVHWGGGSPTLLSSRDIRKLSDHLRSRFEFLPAAEFAVEIDPRGLSNETIDALADAGVNRASLGVQDCDPLVQRAINRWQPFEVTASAANRLRDAGIARLNIDLIYGLPHQTVAHVERTIDQVLTLDPDRLAIFGYAHVPGFKKHQKLISEAALPDAQARLVQYEAASARLQSHGYVAIGLDHFAKAADPMSLALRRHTLRRNFQGYTTDVSEALIGFGASAISALPQGYVQNHTDVPSYRRAIEDGYLPVVRGAALTPEDKLRRAVIGELMCYLEVDTGSLAVASGLPRDHFAGELRELRSLAGQRVIEINGTEIRVNANARSAVRLVCATFDAHLAGSKAQHAAAV